MALGRAVATTRDPGGGAGAAGVAAGAGAGADPCCATTRASSVSAQRYLRDGLQPRSLADAQPSAGAAA